MRSFDTFAAAYAHTIADILSDGIPVSGVSSPRSIGSGFGTRERPFIELQGGGFRLLDPRSRWLATGPRQTNAAFAAANFVFTLAGGHEPEMISTYNARGQQFAEDSSRFEAAFGARLFSPGHQLAYAAGKLRSDKLSRRATALIYSPEDTLLDRRDTPCAIALQFMIRGDRLDAVCFMRSQSAAMVMPYDVFLFTMIQEWLAIEIGIELGCYTHIAASLHLYEEDRDLAERITNFELGPTRSMPKMLTAGHQVAVSLIDTERALRLAGKEPVLATPLDAYWRRFLEPIVAARSASDARSESYFVMEGSAV